MMRNNIGFTLIELLVIIAIIAVLSSIGAPAFLQWRGDAKLRDAVSSLRGDLEMAKLRAMRDNEFVAVLFNTNNYLVFIDDGAGAGGVAENWNRDGDERILRNRQMPAGVRIDLGNTTFSDDRTRFNGRGRIGNQGVVIIVNKAGDQRTIDINNRFGRITVN
ncbi:MAG: GspH/FimT family pseudopilin [Desulfobacterales bacterium]|jgi:type IV fimbrial biogenesis protein FimT|nr:GspH/FimT family pseudopilin [Desulfobacterales bacterium]